MNSKIQIRLTTLAALAALALTGCGATSTSSTELTKADKDEIFELSLLSEGFEPESIDAGRDFAIESCRHADKVGAVQAVTDVFWLTLSYSAEAREMGAVALGVGFATYCPEHTWAFDELAK